MPVGIVKWFNVDKGYGFIQPESGNDVFVHVSTIQEGGSLEEGQAVEFDIAEGRKAPRPSTCARWPPSSPASHRDPWESPSELPGAGGPATWRLQGPPCCLRSIQPISTTALCPHGAAWLRGRPGRRTAPGANVSRPAATPRSRSAASRPCVGLYP